MANVRYTRHHEYIRIDGDVGTIGISDYAQQQLGDVVHVDVPEPGGQLTAGAAFGTIESVKAVSELFSPVSGEVIAVNGDLANHPGHVNSKPHETWMIRVKVANAAETGSLLDAAASGGKQFSVPVNIHRSNVMWFNKKIMADNGIDRATALRWDMQAMGANGDVGYYCYLWGMSYSQETGINDTIGTKLALAA